MKLASLQGNYRADNGLTMDAAAVREAPVLGLVRWTAGPGGVPCGHREQSEERPLRRARLPLSRFGMGADRGSWEAHVECSGSVRVCISWECVHNFAGRCQRNLYRVTRRLWAPDNISLKMVKGIFEGAKGH